MSAKIQKDQYKQIVTRLFFDRYEEGMTEIPFSRESIAETAEILGIKPPKNLGDLVYAFRYRRILPDEILATQPKGLEWIIEGTGTAQYSFCLVPESRILVDSSLDVIEIPDSTPSLISTYALSDEQSLLAKVRYNRLIDIFLGITSYSLQNHLRTSVKEIGQIEIDEIYLGIDKEGEKYVVPVQAKVGKDQLGTVQTKQDIIFCQRHPKFKNLSCRPVSAQFMDSQVIALFELQFSQNHLVSVISQRHYKLVSTTEV